MSSMNIGFPLDLYPTLRRASESPALIRLVKGPAGCLPRETEIFTRNGWQSIAEATDEALVYCPDTGTAYFAPVGQVSYPEPNGFWRVHNTYTIDMVVSDEHKVWTKTYRQLGSDRWSIRSGDYVGSKLHDGIKLDGYIPTTFNYVSPTSVPYTDTEIRIQIMISADGTLIRKGRKVAVQVRKARKVARVEQLLNDAGIDFVRSDYCYNGEVSHRFSFVPPIKTKSMRFLYGANAAQLRVAAEELLFWDGTQSETHAHFTTTVKENADVAQFVFTSVGIPSKLAKYDLSAKNKKWADAYRVSYGVKRNTAWANLATCTAERVPASDGMKYCLTTPTGMFIARHNGKVFATGNSAKTSWAIMELLRSALLQTPSPLDNTRYFRALVVRNTYALLKSNTIPSMKNMFGPLLQVTEGSQPFGRVRARLQDGTALDMEVQFLALDSEDAQDKLLGAEPTMVLCDELNLMPESVVFALVRRLGRYPSGTKGKVDRTGVIGVFNGPVKGSWLHKWYLGERDAQFEKVAREMGVEKLVEMFSQPPALIPPAGFPNSHDPNDEWLPNPEAENIQNLAQGYGYYYAMLADPDMGKIQSYVLGEFADVKHGKVVFPEFHRDVHTFPAERVNTKELRDYYLAFDFGRTPVCIVGTLLSDGTLMVLDEFMGEDMSVEQLYRSTVRPALKRDYPNGVCVRAYGDPAGMTGGQNINLSPFDVLRKEGVPIVAPTRSNRLEPRLAAVRSFMSSLGTGGKPRLLIRDNCRFLIQAMAADYIYENRSGGRTADTPTKSHVGWVSDLCLAAGTMIATPDGSVPIQHIRVGDEVVTRTGVRKVLAAAMTSPSAEVFEYDIGGIKLTATPNHPVFANGAFHAIDSLVGSTVYCNIADGETEQHGMTGKPVSVSVERGERSVVPVYNLTVETDNEYYANGVLVHNCDSMQYLAMGLLLVMSTGDDDAAQYETQIEWC